MDFYFKNFGSFGLVFLLGKMILFFSYSSGNKGGGERGCPLFYFKTSIFSKAPYSILRYLLLADLEGLRRQYKLVLRGRGGRGKKRKKLLVWPFF